MGGHSRRCRFAPGLVLDGGSKVVESSKKKKPITAAARKAKGKQWEKTVAGMIAQAVGMTEEDIQNARSGKKESDIQLSGEARRRFPYHVECKNQSTAKVPAWIRQMEEDLLHHRKRGTPFRSGMVVFKEHGNRTPYVLMRFADVLKLLTGGKFDE